MPEVYQTYTWPIWDLHSLWLIPVVLDPNCNSGRGLPEKRKDKNNDMGDVWFPFSWMKKKERTGDLYPQRKGIACSL